MRASHMVPDTVVAPLPPRASTSGRSRAPVFRAAPPRRAICSRSASLHLPPAPACKGKARWCGIRKKGAWLCEQFGAAAPFHFPGGHPMWTRPSRIAMVAGTAPASRTYARSFTESSTSSGAKGACWRSATRRAQLAHARSASYRKAIRTTASTARAVSRFWGNGIPWEMIVLSSATTGLP